MTDKKKKILVTGATGYVGGRLIPRLLNAGYEVRCLVRDETRLRGYTWLSQVEVIQADLLDPYSLPPALKDISVAYYLVQGMRGARPDPEPDQIAARNFVAAAEKANIEHIIYLGELADPHAELSSFLRSRLDTGEILRSGPVPATEFRAGMIVGSGSALFEMIRYLTEREPVLICPRWFYTLAQPIAIRNVLDYLVAALQQADPTIGSAAAQLVTASQPAGLAPNTQSVRISRGRGGLAPQATGTEVPIAFSRVGRAAT